MAFPTDFFQGFTTRVIPQEKTQEPNEPPSSFAEDLQDQAASMMGDIKLTAARVPLPLPLPASRVFGPTSEKKRPRPQPTFVPYVPDFSCFSREDTTKEEKTIDPYPRDQLTALGPNDSTSTTPATTKVCPSAPKKRARISKRQQRLADVFLARRYQILANGYENLTTEFLGHGSFMDVYKVTQPEEKTFPLFPKTFVVKVFRELYLRDKPAYIEADVNVALKVYRKLRQYNIPVARIINAGSIFLDGCLICEYIPHDVSSIKQMWTRDPHFNPETLRRDEKIIFNQMVRIFQQCFKHKIAADLLIDNFRMKRDRSGRIRVVISDVLGQSKKSSKKDLGYLNVCFLRFIQCHGLHIDGTNPPKVVKTRNQHVYNALLNTPDPTTGTVDLEAQRLMPEIIFT